MSASLSLPFSFLLIVLFSCFLQLLTFTASTSIPLPSSSVASRQHEIWLKNVVNNMPNTILSKLSPLSIHDSNHFTYLVSNPLFVSNLNFCSLANLACASNLNTIKPLENNFINYKNDKRNPDVIKPLENNFINYKNDKRNPDVIKPLDNTADSSADPFSFFRLSVLKQGKTVHLPDLQDTSPFRAFLPSQIASKFSLTSKEALKKVFPESFVSPITKDAIERTLGYCNAPTVKGEIKSCVSSLEDMIQFAKKGLGVKKLVSLTSKSTRGSGKQLLVGNVKAYDDAKKIVSCHEVYFPFSTYFCHLISSSRLFSVELLEPETRVAVNTVVAVCHMDTSEWPANHVAFRILKLTPGKGEACHWFSQVGLAWIGA